MPEIFSSNAKVPTPTLEAPVVVSLKAPYPIATLSFESVADCNVSLPTPTLLAPVVIVKPEFLPI